MAAKAMARIFFTFTAENAETAGNLLKIPNHKAEIPNKSQIQTTKVAGVSNLCELGLR
jgi:hypothetical protein